METKAIFLDVDGTLVSFDTHRVPQSAIEALQQVHESGIVFRSVEQPKTIRNIQT